MDFKDVVNRRRTIRDFDAKKIPQNIIIEALEAGVKAPSYDHLRNWDFVLINDIEVRKALTGTEEMIDKLSLELVEQFDKHDETAKEMYLDAIPKQKQMILSAPELLVMVYKPKTSIENSSKVYDLNCFASIWCCIENILLSLAENEVFGVTFIPKNTKSVKNILNIPSELEVAAIIPFGYKADNCIIPKQKDFRLEERLHYDKWKY